MDERLKQEIAKQHEAVKVLIKQRDYAKQMARKYRTLLRKIGELPCECSRAHGVKCPSCMVKDEVPKDQHVQITGGALWDKKANKPIQFKNPNA